MFAAAQVKMQHTRCARANDHLIDPEEAFRLLSDTLDLTPREAEVFDKLVRSEESIQEIADTLYLSRRTCQRHIASIYEKAGVKSRLGLYQIYIEKQHKK